MTNDQIKSTLANLRLGSGGRALHKPLLVLLMMGRYWHNKTRLVSFPEIKDLLTELLCNFYERKEYKFPEDPFVHLEKEFWDVEDAASLVEERNEKNKISPAGRIRILRGEIRAGFCQDWYLRMVHNKYFLLELVFLVFKRYFPEQSHCRLLRYIGIPSEDSRAGLAAEREFKEEVLKLYNYQCSLCRCPEGPLADIRVVLQATHIKWPVAGGPWACNNAIALCSNHKGLFDAGAFTLVPAGDRIQISSQYHAAEDSSNHLYSYQNSLLVRPKQEEDWPSRKYIDWHNEVIFRNVRCEEAT